MNKQDKILITGASGLIGSALVRLLKAEGYENLLTPQKSELNWLNPLGAYAYFHDNMPDYVFHLAARVGGIQDNDSNPAIFCRENTQMHCNVFDACREFSVKKLLFPGSACAYPANADQPIKESAFLTGAPEPTNIGYALAKQNGIVMAQSYAKQYGLKVVLPMVTNAYGVGDKSSHVIPMMIEKSRDEIPSLWGDGSPSREFIHADDVASAFLFLMENYDSADIINIGTQEEISMHALFEKILNLNLRPPTLTYWDTSKSNGVMRKCLDSSRIRAMGWESKISLDEGLRGLL